METVYLPNLTFDCSVLPKPTRQPHPHGHSHFLVPFPNKQLFFPCLKYWNPPNCLVLPLFYSPHPPWRASTTLIISSTSVNRWLYGSGASLSLQLQISMFWTSLSVCPTGFSRATYQNSVHSLPNLHQVPDYKPPPLTCVSGNSTVKYLLPDSWQSRLIFPPLSQIFKSGRNLHKYFLLNDPLTYTLFSILIKTPVNRLSSLITQSSVHSSYCWWKNPPHCSLEYSSDSISPQLTTFDGFRLSSE